jgi:hypothetical protein
MTERHATKVVLVLCGDEAIQGSLRALIDDAGCRAVTCPSLAQARARLATAQPVLVLVDPLLHEEAASAFADVCGLAVIPMRTSSTGVRRFAKHSTGAVRWLRELVTQHCRIGP